MVTIGFAIAINWHGYQAHSRYDELLPQNTTMLHQFAQNNVTFA